MNIQSPSRPILAALAGLVVGVVLMHVLELHSRASWAAVLQEEYRRELDARLLANHWIAFRSDVGQSVAAHPAESECWLVFSLGYAGAQRQQQEGLVCGKVAAALDSWGEVALAQQAWEQTRRLLGFDSVSLAKESVRAHLDAAAH